MTFELRGASVFLRPFVSDTSPKCIDWEGLGGHRTGKSGENATSRETKPKHTSETFLNTRIRNSVQKLSNLFPFLPGTRNREHKSWSFQWGNFRRQEEPAILIFRLLSRMRRMYVASIRLDFHYECMECAERTLITRVWTFYHSLSDHACFDHLSRETCPKHSAGVKAF